MRALQPAPRANFRHCRSCPTTRRLAQPGARFKFGGERGQEFVHRRLLHQSHERFERAEVQGFDRISGKAAGETEFGRQAVADAGNQHAATDICQEFTASIWSIHAFFGSQRFMDIINR